MRKIILTISLFLIAAVYAVAAPKATNRTVQYQSVDQYGDTLTLSGKLTIPASGTAKGIILMPHYTIGANKEAPSLSEVYGEKVFRDDYVLIQPDYIGYGITADRFPPYLHGELTARNCVDMILETRNILDTTQVSIQTDSLTIIGFSQGAATALWTLKLLEERYADLFPVKACYAGSGPYDVATTYDVATMQNRVGLPMTIPLLIIGTSTAYNLDLQHDDFFSPATEKLFDKYIASKKYGILGITLRMSNHRVDHWMTAAGVDKSQQETQRLYNGFLRSSLVHYPVDNHPVGQDSICPSWKPRTQTYIFHSTTDDVVCFPNAAHLQRCWGDMPNVTYDFGDYGNHLRSMQLFIKKITALLKE